MNKGIILTIISLALLKGLLAQTTDSVAAAVPVADTAAPAKDTLSKFDSFNKKMEHLFKIIPVPIVSYSTEAGTTIGLAKFNLFKLSKKDTISNPSKISEVVTFSTKGRINASISTELIWKEKKYMAISYVNYKKNPEYLFGIGNDVSRDDMEEITTERIKFLLNGLIRLKKDKNIYGGFILEIMDYFNMELDSSSFLIKDQVKGVEGGFSNGIGASFAYDSRDNRYNAYSGSLILTSFAWHPTFIGSKYQYSKWVLDTRKFWNPWKNHVIAVQATTTWTDGNEPFYDMAMMGGDSKMRGYYEGAYRDNVLVDAQVEYRMPVWKIFGVAAWIATGRVGKDYGDMSLDGFHLSYGGGIRIKVDSKNNTNMRFDFGFGPHGISGTYINFAEAF
ncbi:BamA/TamA family outer membrane protein [Flavihumibacter petaseus]|uniref:Bacterial surface antigen (D15) domain-containing protein n=1 Tax=Flavihumibacter petaseus NBRC 106054 TaxID=1220578 RepID=A0A0E9MVF6_9BACT|nr:BamA/TamA family outer membrane protein [Flavihumibacter petaseus]GAO41115.1 hypothetical protein FPE01S_01_01270 [Flavihumibacter petaseus NBRC 106054]